MGRSFSKKNYLLVYSLLFALFAGGAFLVFLVSGKSFVWNQDGGPQYVPYLAYTGRYLRDFVRRVLQGDFTIKMFDFTIGYGEDVGNVFRAHPLDFLSVFVPTRYTEQLYVFLILLRIYLAGLSFSAFCLYWRMPERDVLAGAMIYAFCGHVMRLGIVHPTFLSALIILPLLLLAAERLMRREGWLMLSFAVFLGFMSNYYFMYMCTIALAVYALIRLPALCRGEGAGQFLRLLFGMAGAFLLGTAMAASTLVPVIFSLSSSARLAQESVPQNLWRYQDIRRYYRWFLDLIAPCRGTGDSTFLNYAAPVLPALLLLFIRRERRERGLRTAFLLELAFLLIPAGAYVMAGFSNVTNRWVFIFSFTAAFIYVTQAQRLRHLRRGEKLALILLLIFYGALAWWDGASATRPYTAAGTAALAACLAVLLLADRLGQRRCQNAMLGLIFVCVLSGGYLTYDEHYGGEAAEFLDRGTSIPMILDSGFARVSLLQDAGFYRVDSDLVTSNTENYSLLLGYRPTAQYNSVLNGPLTYSLLETENIGLGAIHRFQGLDGRTALEALANVGYFFTSADGGGKAPYGFERLEEYSDDTYSVYRNRLLLPFGYTYDQGISREDYLKLEAADRQQVMLEAAVTDKVPKGLTAVRKPEESTKKVALTLPETGENVVRTKEGYRVTKKNGSITIAYQRRAGYECYVRLTGFSQKRTYTFVQVDSAQTHTLVLMRGEGTLYSLNRSDYLVNLGYAGEDQEDEIQLTMSQKGNYQLTGAQLIYVPMSGYEQQIARRSEGALSQTVFGINRISGRAEEDKARMMVFSLPYSKGWSAEVDGEKTQVLQVNTAWTGVMLPAGRYQVTLTYTTPGAIPGRILAAAGWLVFGLLGVRVRRRHQKADRGR